MTQYIPSEYFDYILEEISKADGISLCTNQPLTYYNAEWPNLWTASVPYVIGDTVRPPTVNGFIYECTTSGTSGSFEPVFGLTQDALFSDGSVVWKTHINYSIANSIINSGEIVITNETYGKKLTTPQKSSVTHASGTVLHTALISTAERKLKLVTNCLFPEPPDNQLVSGRTIVFAPFSFNRYNL